PSLRGVEGDVFSALVWGCGAEVFAQG
ncbi:MAG: hypothetical protein QOE95_178, partial [Gaiellaceae bacterium]|nr:hypothetical protein [Gaiellaceae bacterium]